MIILHDKNRICPKRLSLQRCLACLAHFSFHGPLRWLMSMDAMYHGHWLCILFTQTWCYGLGCICVDLMKLVHVDRQQSQSLLKFTLLAIPDPFHQKKRKMPMVNLVLIKIITKFWFVFLHTKNTSYKFCICTSLWGFSFPEIKSTKTYKQETWHWNEFDCVVWQKCTGV